MLVFHGFWNEKRILTHFRRTLISRRIYGVGLKVATKQAAKEMIDSPAVAVPGMPLNGRAYLLVGTGSRFEYFQSTFTGANRNINVEPPVFATQVTNSGRRNTEFYSSKRDNKQGRKNSAQVSEHDTQLLFL